MDEEELHRLKSLECLAGAESELAAARFNNAANRAYYACFHAAIAALLRAGTRRQTWEHYEVQALFTGGLVIRRKLYRDEFRSTLQDLMEVRLHADYGLGTVSKTRAERALRRANRYVASLVGIDHEN